MKKKTMTIAALAALLLFAGVATAQPGGIPGRPMGNEGAGTGAQRSGGDENILQRMLPMMRMLDLSDDQRDAIAEIIEKARDSMESIRGTEEQGSQREDFPELFSSSSLSVSEVENLLNSRLDVMEEVNAIMAEALVDIHNVLTPEQLAALAEFNPGSMDMRGSDRGNTDPSRTNMGLHLHR